jgi:hypothetical protein
VALLEILLAVNAAAAIINVVLFYVLVSNLVRRAEEKAVVQPEVDTKPVDGLAPHRVPVVSEDAPKPPTKSQQRRINVQKGHGAFTDDELREQRNEKRRAARAAKAAEPDAIQPTLKEKIAAEK